jgi:4a-hydroxytetrahydrobiopterin dehydratase
MTIEVKYMDLSQSKCKPCEKGVPPLTPEELESYKQDDFFSWDIVDNKKIVKDFKFDNYSQTIAFVNKVAYLAEDEGHHPVMHVYFSKVTVEYWTHAIDGLSENDFIMAAKLDEIHV